MVLKKRFIEARLGHVFVYTLPNPPKPNKLQVEIILASNSKQLSQLLFNNANHFSADLPRMCLTNLVLSTHKGRIVREECIV